MQLPLAICESIVQSFCGTIFVIVMTFLKSVNFSTAFGLDLGQLVIELMHL
jgi:hypothetical protein